MPDVGPVVHVPLPAGPPALGAMLAETYDAPPILPMTPMASVHFGTITAGTTITIQGTCTANTLLGAAYGTAAGRLLGDSINGLTLHQSNAITAGHVYFTGNITVAPTLQMSTLQMTQDEAREQNRIWAQWSVADQQASDRRAWTQIVAQQQVQFDAEAHFAQQQHAQQQWVYPGNVWGNEMPPAAPSPAEVRARDLLDTVLDAAQRAEMQQHRYFTVIGNHTRRRYRVHVDKGRHGNITEVDAAGVSVRRLCCAPNGCPESDALVGQKLFLELSEEEFVRTANVTDLRNGDVVAGARFIEQGGLLRAG